MPVTRRTFIKTGLLGGALLGAGGAGYSFFSVQDSTPYSDGAYRYCFLTEQERMLLASIAPVILAGSNAVTNIKTLEAHLVRLDVLICNLPVATQKELRQLFQLMLFAPTRWVTTRITGWQNAHPDAVNACLNRWKNSGTQLFRSAYYALVQINMGAWYSEQESWGAINYPGPPNLKRYLSTDNDAL